MSRQNLISSGPDFWPEPLAHSSHLVQLARAFLRSKRLCPSRAVSPVATSLDWPQRTPGARLISLAKIHSPPSCGVFTPSASTYSVGPRAIAENLTLEPIMGKRLNVMDEAHLRCVIDAAPGRG